MQRTSTWLVALWIGICSAVGSRSHFGRRSTQRPSVGDHGVCVLSCGSARPSQYANPEPTGTIVRVNCSTYVMSRADWLENFITTTHRGLDNPSGMPNPSLLDYQVKQVTAYLLSLRK